MLVRWTLGSDLHLLTQRWQMRGYDTSPLLFLCVPGVFNCNNPEEGQRVQHSFSSSSALHASTNTGVNQSSTAGSCLPQSECHSKCCMRLDPASYDQLTPASAQTRRAEGELNVQEEREGGREGGRKGTAAALRGELPAQRCDRMK